MATYKVGYFVGSLSSTSINRLLAKALGRLAPPELVLTEIPIKDLPLYSPDFDADYPPVARALKQAIADVDAVLFVTPEYNRSIPGGLKNAIHWASRPYGQNSFRRKPSAVIGTSSGAMRYTQALITQMAQTAVCNRHHSLDQQLCRWLLLSLDRLDSRELVVTQELIANMLGVRREGVTEAAGDLQKAGLIRYRRGHITVLDRQ